MAREVEIPEIEGIIPRLVVVGRMVVPLSTLEFNWENAGAGDEHCIDATSQSGHLKLEEDRAVQFSQRILENLDFLLPCPSLLKFEIVRVSRGKLSQDLINVLAQEIGDSRRTVGGVGTLRCNAMHATSIQQVT